EPDVPPDLGEFQLARAAEPAQGLSRVSEILLVEPKVHDCLQWGQQRVGHRQPPGRAKCPLFGGRLLSRVASRCPLVSIGAHSARYRVAGLIATIARQPHDVFWES